MLGTGNYLVLPGESDVTLVRQMVARFDRDATGAGLSTASAAKLGLTPYEVIISASVVEKEGYYPVNMPKTARVIYNRLANGMPLQMDSTVLYALGQDGGPVTPQDLQDPVALQHLPQQRPAADADLHAVADRAEGRGRSAGRCVALLRPRAEERGHGLLRHLRRAAGQRAAGQVTWTPLSRSLTMEEARARCGPEATVVGVIGSPIAHSLSPRACTTPPSPPWGSPSGTRSPSRCRAGEAGRALEDMRRHRPPWTVGHHAAQGGRWPPRWTPAARWRGAWTP